MLKQISMPVLMRQDLHEAAFIGQQATAEKALNDALNDGFQLVTQYIADTPLSTHVIFVLHKKETPAPKGTPAHIIRVERDNFYSKTSGDYRSMWRCTTKEGYQVNIFDHADPLRNTFKLFEDANYDGYLKTMAVGQIDLWETYPIAVELRINGDFWNVVSVAKRPDYAFPLTHIEDDYIDNDIKDNDGDDDIPFDRAPIDNLRDSAAALLEDDDA